MDSFKKDQEERRIAHGGGNTFGALPQTVLSRVASFLPIEGVQALSQVSRSTRDATVEARGQIASLGLTGKATVGDQHLYTKDAHDADTRFYFPTSLSGTHENFPHVTRRANPAHTPHLTDVGPVHQAAMPNGLPPGNYPTRHRFDIQPDKRLSPVVLPATLDAKKTGTLAQVGPGSGLSAMHYVAPRYKAKVDNKEVVPGIGIPVKLTSAQTTGASPNWSGQPVKFFNK